MLESIVPLAELNEMCSLITDGTHFSPPTSSAGQFLYLTSRNIRPGLIDLSTVCYVTEEVHDKIYKACPVLPGDVLFVKDGVNTGTAAVNTLAEQFSMLSSVALLRPHAGQLDARYLVHWLNSPAGRAHMMRNMSGSAIRRLVLREIRRAQIPIPSISKQRRIADVLDRAEALRTKRRAVLAQFDALAQSIFLEVFGDPITNPRAWPRSELNGLCRSAEGIKCGPFGTQLAKREVGTEGVPLWGIRNVNALFELPTHEFLSVGTAKRLMQYSLEPGDIVMTRKGTVGNCAVYPEKFPLGIMHSDLLRIRVDRDTCDPIFLSHQLHYSRNVERQLLLISGGAVMPGINVTKLKSLTVLVPPLQLQRKFAHQVRALEKLKSVQYASSRELDILFESLQHRAFRGELFTGTRECSVIGTTA